MACAWDAAQPGLATSTVYGKLLSVLLGCESLSLVIAIGNVSAVCPKNAHGLPHLEAGFRKVGCSVLLTPGHGDLAILHIPCAHNPPSMHKISML